MSCGLLCVVVGCKSKTTAAPEPQSSAPQPSSSAAEALLKPIPSAYVEAALNPGHEKPYSGPIGAVHGVVHVSGDPAPDVPGALAQLAKSKNCESAKPFYGKLFREGPGRELADVLVAVTNYKGFVPPRGDVKLVTARGCAFESRTVAMTFGQRLEVKNRGSEAVIPTLSGTQQAALIVAFPGGDSVKLFPDHPGEFLLQDQSHPFATADVFVLKYPTTAVTGIDGTFEIKDVPAGSVVVSAYLPSTAGRTSAPVNVVAGETATVELTIPFDAVKFAAAAPSASAH
ncbi:MAG TPA: carboxypeptidase-like regulatory domain-containing protein [Polyangiaceae bacterium]|nr:carboxypeptidase-like regulatory domain-containing protein [Polyangiaceae bacterium]